MNKASATQVTSPEESTASTTQTRTPWSAGTQQSAKSSVTTIDDDILFDVKSFRDSNGQAAQFEMTRPTSTAVELYRSMSHNIKARAPKPSLTATISTRDSIAVAGEFQAIDETIAAVEKMTRRDPLTPPSSPPKQPTLSQWVNVDLPSPGGSPPRTTLVTTTVESPSPARSPSRAHLAQLLDGSPHPKSSLDMQEVTSLPVIPIPVIQVDSPVLGSNSDVPPPVPPKDTKFVPVSKYARKPGDRRSKPRRSFTDSAALPTVHGSPSSPQQAFKPRSNTSPGSDAKLRPEVHQSRRPGHPLYRMDKPAVTTVTAVVQPVAEVSVARTISLSRKQSARVLVSTRKGDVKVDEDLKEEEKRKTRFELLETRPYSPAVIEGLPGHKIGKSVHALIESA